jgi:rare lipoprotein A
MTRTKLLPILCCIVLAGAAGAASAASVDTAHGSREPARHARRNHRVDRSGQPRIGKASIYAHKFAGRKMADGHRMNPRDGNAASKTLPLGTVAKVTNLENGKSTVVTIQDRGPHVPGRIVDLSPASARQIGLDKKQGLARVAVTPIAVPAADGVVHVGDAVAHPADAVADAGTRQP